MDSYTESIHSKHTTAFSKHFLWMDSYTEKGACQRINKNKNIDEFSCDMQVRWDKPLVCRID